MQGSLKISTSLDATATESVVRGKTRALAKPLSGCLVRRKFFLQINGFRLKSALQNLLQPPNQRKNHDYELYPQAVY